jgi:hypothetical protein
MCPCIYLVRFDLPCSIGTLPAPLGKYVNLRATIGGESIVRSYSPISRPSAVGHVDFLIKVRLCARCGVLASVYRGPCGVLGAVCDVRVGTSLPTRRWPWKCVWGC